MTFLLQLLGGKFGALIAGATAALLAASILTATVQTKRLESAQVSVATARAALKNPVTGKTWQSEAIRDARVVTDLSGKLTLQNTAVERLKGERDAAVAESDRALQAARKSTTETRKSVDALLAMKPGADVCASALDVLHGVRR